MSLINRIVRRLSRFAWAEVMHDVARVEWKYGRNDDGLTKDWTEWDCIRVHLIEAGRLRKAKELTQSMNDAKIVAFDAADRTVTIELAQPIRPGSFAIGQTMRILSNPNP
jgi:hypothetical protein